MSRFAKPKEPVETGGTPIWVVIVYALGLMAGGIIVLSLAFNAVVHASGDPVHVNVPAFVLWGALVVIAAGLLVWRRRRGAR